MNASGNTESHQLTNNNNRNVKMSLCSFSTRKYFHSFVILMSATQNQPLPKIHSSKANFYTILDVHREATPTEIKGAYFQRSKLFHPDLNKSERAKPIYNDIREAYEILGNYNTKKEYDKLLRDQEIREAQRNRRVNINFDTLLHELRQKQKQEFKEKKQKDPMRNSQQDRNMDWNPDAEDKEWEKADEDFKEYGKYGRKDMENLAYKVEQDDPMHRNSQQYKKFEKLLETSVYFRALLLLLLSSGPLTLALAYDEK